MTKLLMSSAGSSTAANYIEDVFSTYLYTGNGSTQTITNGINLSTNGGLVWIKSRSAVNNNFLTDTMRGGSQNLRSDTTGAQQNDGTLTFNANGFSAPSSNGFGNSGVTFASWTFRKQAKFFDVVTYTGNGTQNRAISHALGSAPGFIVVKQTNTAANWYCKAPGLGTSQALLLNTTDAVATYTNVWGTTIEDATNFYVGNVTTNASGGTYVAYLFAHNAGGFGLTGTDNVISCGSFTTDGSGNATVNLGYEPQWLLVKDLANNQYFQLVDNMRALTATAAQAAELYAGATQAETVNGGFAINATGFTVSQYISTSYIYIAIRRGPMKVPTSGTSVYEAYSRPVGETINVVNTAFPADTFWAKNTTSSSYNWFDYDRLRGNTQYLATNTTGAEITGSGNYFVKFNYDQLKLHVGEVSDYNTFTTGSIFYWMRRAPGFFDEVCWTTTGAAQTLNHNLGVVPELMIRKVRNGTWEGWMVYAAAIGNTKILYLDQTAAQDTNNGWDNKTPTSTQFFVNNTLSGYNMVTYLFATVAGVSKVGSYTGNGTTQTINCGFTGGARFVLIKRTDSTGDWYVWDTARGIVTANDPHLSLNTTAADVTTDDSIDPDSSGFIVNQLAATNINVSAATYIFLAIA